MEDYFDEIAEDDSDDESEKSDRDLTDMSDEDILDMSIDQINGCCDQEMRREHFIRAVLLVNKLHK